MLLTSADLGSIHRYCTRHRPLMDASSHAGCLSCGASFAPSEVREWIQDRIGTNGEIAGETARCPRCGTDSVLPSAAPVVLTPATLAAVQRYWFSGSD